MYLSKLKLIGFKSFAQKTSLEFNEGISCIIGPNGSGKSNIVDAIRWVLGEQRTTTLRSDKMENVIFNGSKDRKPMGMAEVALTLENNKGILKTDFSEVVVSRRLYRSGESQYLINNTPVRLKDVLDLFMDTGLGPNSYSVIELKMVESILSENKQERRQLFEEAAGVIKYKIRRKSALRKLEATRTDLNRVNDIISEVQKTVNSLSRQVGKARRYLNYTEELKKLEIDLARFRYHHLLDEIRPLTRQLHEESKVKEEAHHQITMDEALLEDYKRERVEIEKQLQEINRLLHELDSKVSQINQQQAVAQTRSEELVKTRSRYTAEIEDFHKKIQLLKENMERYQQELDELLSQKEDVDAKFREIEADRKAELEKLQKEKQEIEGLNQSFRQKLAQVSQIKDQLKQHELQIRFKNEQLQTIQQQIGEQKNVLTSLETQKKQLASEKQKINLQREEAKKHLEDLQQKETQANVRITGLNERKRELLSQLEQYKSRRQFFEQIIANYEGHSLSTQFVMSQRDQIKGLIGPLSDVFTVQEPYARTVELLLENTLDFILVETVQTARAVIDLIKKENKGRITLLPLDKIDRIDFQRPRIEGAQGAFLIDFIRTDSRYQKLLELLLGDILVADTFDQALSLAEKYPHLRVITKGGEIINFDREISAGAQKDQQTSILGRKERLKKYVSLIRETEKDLAELDRQIKQKTGELEKLIRQKTQLNNDLNALYERSVELDKEENQVNYEFQKNKSALQQNEQKIAQLRKEVATLEQALKSFNDKLKSEQESLNQLERETIRRTSEYERNSDLLNDLLNEVQQARINVTNLQNQIDNRQRDLDRTKRELAELESRIRHHEQEIEQIDRTIVQLEQETKQRRATQKELWEKRDSLEDQKNEIERKFQESQTKIIELEEETRKYRRQHDSTLEKTRQLELKINEHRYKAEALREQILDEYQEDIEIGLPYDGLDEKETEERIDVLKQRIKNLGMVNPLAVTEYDKEKERLDFLTKQRDDLLNAEQSLMETIRKINKTARKQFMETFTAIKENFEKVFKSFFENGEGTLKLEENADPLEADIEIEVRTKSRSIQTLSLLSGGEKTLTAISLLFAIYLVKPSPFCILDEVDAPLDDVNIGRFTEALKDFSQNTQFIVVTHNKRTMEAANTMYGVTMEEEGVSKLVSVKFS